MLDLTHQILSPLKVVRCRHLSNTNSIPLGVSVGVGLGFGIDNTSGGGGGGGRGQRTAGNHSQCLLQTHVWPTRIATYGVHRVHSLHHIL